MKNTTNTSTPGPSVVSSARSAAGGPLGERLPGLVVQNALVWAQNTDLLQEQAQLVNKFQT